MARVGPETAAIRVEGLTRRFGGFTAVDAVRFSVERGEVFGLLGPNGAGKTTLVRMLTTLLAPSAGRAWVAGHEISSEQTHVRERIGVIPQALTSDLDLTGWENLDVYGQFYGVRRSERHARAQQLLEMVGLAQRRDDLVATYSGGMRRRLEIARGLIHAPEVLFLDEPTIGLDPQSRRVVWDLLQQLREQSEITLSLTTHYMDEAEELCDRIAIVDDGHIIALDTPRGLKSQIQGSDRIDLEVEGDVDAVEAMIAQRPGIHGVEHTGPSSLRIAIDDGAREIPRLVDSVEALGAQVAEISVQRISLEDVFIHFTGRTLREERTQKVGFFVGPGMPQAR
jgi:ABC-2 type transport system ATP-binding protein